MSEETALELRDIVAGYGESTVLRGVSLVVPAGTAVALLGPNGAGKTTLLRVASGALAPRSGSVLLAGRDMTRKPDYRRARLGLCHIPEGHGVFPTLSVRENLLLHGRGVREKDVLGRACDAFPVLGQRLSQVAGSLSGGQQQMLALVRAWLGNPQVVLIDEASMGLAPVLVDEIFEFVDTVVANGTSLLLVEQYVQRACAIADQVYLLTQGEITFSGRPGELAADRIFREYLGKSVAAHNVAAQNVAAQNGGHA